MVYTYPATGNSNLLLENLLGRELGSSRVSSPFDLNTLPKEDVVVFLDFENDPDFKEFVGLMRTILVCRSIYVTQGVNYCESILRGHYNMSFAEKHVLADLPIQVANYVEGKLEGLTNWRAKWKT